MATYYVSGIIQIEVKAKSAEDAVRKALKRERSLMKSSQSLNIELDNISSPEHVSVGLDEASDLDA